MQKINLKTVKLKKLLNFTFTGVPNYSGYQSYTGKYIIVHHFISCLGEFMSRIMGNTCEIDSLTNPTCTSAGRVGLV